MNKKVSAWENLTPEDLIEKMFERTDADGVLYMPSFFTEEHGDRASLRCVMSWELPGDCFSVLQEFDQLRSAIEQIAERCDREGDLGEGGMRLCQKSRRRSAIPFSPALTPMQRLILNGSMRSGRGWRPLRTCGRSANGSVPEEIWISGRRIICGTMPEKR